MFAQPTVMVISGWGGSGKTQTIGRALQGLGRNINEVGVIINERSRGSVDIDIARLPKGFEKLGLHGCACCSQLSDVLAGIKGFASQGRTLTFIEQSPLSVTGDLRNGLRQRGHDNIVVFLFNPAQFNDAPAEKTGHPLIQRPVDDKSGCLQLGRSISQTSTPSTPSSNTAATINEIAPTSRPSWTTCS
jgi:hypothetical protein